MQNTGKKARFEINKYMRRIQINSIYTFKATENKEEKK